MDQENFLTFNALPTYENIRQVYEELQLPLLHENLLTHKKERVLLMIINMMRVRPKIFMTQLADLKAKCQNRQKPKNLIFQAEDVELAKELLMDVRSVHPLDLQAELCD